MWSTRGAWLIRSSSEVYLIRQCSRCPSGVDALPFRTFSQRAVMTYTFPELSHDYIGLENAMKAETLERHHSKHHAAYVKGANDTLEKLAAARDAGDHSGQARR